MCICVVLDVCVVFVFSVCFVCMSVCVCLRMQGWRNHLKSGGAGLQKQARRPKIKYQFQCVVKNL